MLQTLDLQKMGLVSLSETEATQIDGGSFWSWLAAGLGTIVGIGLIVGSTAMVAAGGIGLLFMAGLAMNGVFEQNSSTQSTQN